MHRGQRHAADLMPGSQVQSNTPAPPVGMKSILEHEASVDSEVDSGCDLKDEL